MEAWDPLVLETFNLVFVVDASFREESLDVDSTWHCLVSPDRYVGVKGAIHG